MDHQAAREWQVRSRLRYRRVVATALVAAALTAAGVVGAVSLMRTVELPRRPEPTSTGP